MQKGNKVKIIKTGNIWEGKEGTIVSAKDGNIKVAFNLEVEGGSRRVIENFLEENLEMEKENQPLNEDINNKLLQFIEDSYNACCQKSLENDYPSVDDVWQDLENNYMHQDEVAKLFELDTAENSSKVYGIIEAALSKLKVPFYTYDKDDQLIFVENLDETSENLNESLLNEAKEKPEDIIHKYIYLQDLDDKEIPAWNFAARIATAEDMEEGCVCELALDLGYKLFAIEAPGFFRDIIAAKEIKAEDIMEEYGDFLQGKAYIREVK